VDEAEVRRRLAAGRVAHLATVARDGRPRVVPCCFVLDGDVVYSAVDEKPKSSPDLARLRDMAAHPCARSTPSTRTTSWRGSWPST
jgi:hypothetical protein